jgi:hypothetical protein
MLRRYGWRRDTPWPCPMKHVSTGTLCLISDLLDQIRLREGIKEKRLGIFYRKSKSFLHFHEDPAGVFADISVGDDFERYPVNTMKERRALLAAIDKALSEYPAADRALRKA